MSYVFESSIVELIGIIWICVHISNLVARDSVDWAIQICICGGVKSKKAGKPLIADRDCVSTFLTCDYGGLKFANCNLWPNLLDQKYTHSNVVY